MLHCLRLTDFSMCLTKTTLLRVSDIEFLKVVRPNGAMWMNITFGCWLVCQLTSHDPVGELHHGDTCGESAEDEGSGGDDAANDRHDPTSELVRQRTDYGTYK